MLPENLAKLLTEFRHSTAAERLYLIGLAGSGKTTVAELLSAQLNALCISEFHDPIPNEVLDTRVDSPLEQRISAQAWVLGQYEFKDDQARNFDGLTIIDRTWIDAVIYAKIYGQAVFDAICQMAEQRDWLPGKYVVLYARVEVIKVRLQGKFGLSETDWTESWQPYIVQLLDSVLSLARRYQLLTIDTSDIDPQTVCRAVQEVWLGQSDDWIIEDDEADPFDTKPNAA